MKRVADVEGGVCQQGILRAIATPLAGKLVYIRDQNVVQRVTACFEGSIVSNFNEMRDK